ncbi:MAG: hypothetical protein ACFFDF_09600 [Candidatus Odinarchaeota archaeon]
MWYFDQDYSSYFNHITEHPKKKDLRIFRYDLFKINLIDRIINQYLWYNSISDIRYKIRKNEIIAIMTLSDVPKITHIDIIPRVVYNIFDLEDTIKFISELNTRNGEITDIIYLLYTGKLEYQKEQDFIIGIIHSLQYDCPYHHNIIRPSYKKKSTKELINDIMKDEGFDFDLF